MPHFGEGVYWPTPYSYLIYRQGALTKAKPGNPLLSWHRNPDASTVWQAAIDALGTRGGLIQINDGVYDFNATVTNAPYVDLIGEQSPETADWGDRRGVMIRNNNTLATLIDLSASFRHRIEQLTFVSDNVTVDRALYLSTTSYIVIKRCTFNRFEYGIEASAGLGWGNRLIQNRFGASRNIDVYMLGSTHDFEFTNNLLKRGKVHNGLRANFERNNFEGLMADGERHLDVEATDVVHIEDNHLESSPGSGANIRQIQITNCENVKIGINYHAGHSLVNITGVVTANSVERCIIDPHSRFTNCTTDISDSSINRMINQGTATILNGANSVVVPHILAGTPLEVFVNGLHAEVESAYADTFGAANFTIHKGGAGNVTADRTVNWEAVVRP